MFPNDEFQVSESDCCGNGCANCILDAKPSGITKSGCETKTNILLSYQEYEVLEIIDIRPKIIELHAKFTAETTSKSDLILHLPPGHHLMMRAPDIEKAPMIVPETNSNSCTITRPYSPFFTDPDRLEFRILVNLSPCGKMSQFIKRLKRGDKIEFRGAIGSFAHVANRYENLLIFCHGVAIAPILPIIREILADDEDMTRIKVIACFPDVDEILFRQELHDFRSYWNFQSQIYLSRPCLNFKEKLRYKENVVGGKLNETAVKEVVQSCKNFGSVKVVVCGSKGFEEFLVGTLLKEGLQNDVIEVL